LARAFGGLVLASLPVWLTACSDGASPPDGPPGPDLTNPNGTIQALVQYYSYRQADPALALFFDEYVFYPTNPEDIPFLEAGETSWDFLQEKAILELLLVPERTTWIDQVLLEVHKREQRNLPDGTVEFDARVELLLLIGPENLVRAESEIMYVLAPDGDGNYRILEEHESPSLRTDPPLPPPVGQLRAEALEDRGRGSL
jgi:hypothetical protein